MFLITFSNNYFNSCVLTISDPKLLTRVENSRVLTISDPKLLTRMENSRVLTISGLKLFKNKKYINFYYVNNFKHEIIKVII